MDTTIEIEDKTPIGKFTKWRTEHLSTRQFTLILSFFVGLFAAIAAYSLHWIIKQIQMLLTEGFTISSINWLYLVFPVRVRRLGRSRGAHRINGVGHRL